MVSYVFTANCIVIHKHVYAMGYASILSFYFIVLTNNCVIYHCYPKNCIFTFRKTLSENTEQLADGMADCRAISR